MRYFPAHVAASPSRTTLAALGLLAVAAAYHPGSASAQQVQIPTLQVCNATKMEANAYVRIESRIDAAHTGLFILRGKLACSPTNTLNPYPAGALEILGVDMSDSTIQGDIKLTTFEQVTSTGKHSPTMWVNGRCEAAQIAGCRYWLMVVDNTNGQNGKTPTSSASWSSTPPASG